jgi:hypothetical protein
MCLVSNTGAFFHFYCVLNNYLSLTIFLLQWLTAALFEHVYVFDDLKTLLANAAVGITDESGIASVIYAPGAWLTIMHRITFFTW